MRRLWVLALLSGSVGYATAAEAQNRPAAPTPTTTVKLGEDCAAIAKRVYKDRDAAAALAHLRKHNPGLCDGGDVLKVGLAVNVPLLPVGRRKPEPPRLSFVGPAVRTRTGREGWMEALPGQQVDRRMRIETGKTGGAEVSIEDKVKLQLEPNATMVVKQLPAGGRGPGDVQLVDGTLRAGVAAGQKAAPLVVHTPVADVKLRSGGAGARIEADGKERAAVAVYEGSAAVRAGGVEIVIRAGQGTLILPGAGPQLPKDLPSAPSWSAKNPEQPLIVVATGPLTDSQPQGDVVVDFAHVAGVARYQVEVARDPSFNDRRAGGEIEVPPFRATLRPGRYYARVSAVDAQGLVGPPSPVRSFYVITLRSDAAVVGNPTPGEAQLMLLRSLSATLQISGAGQPLQVGIDDRTPEECPAECPYVLGPGDHRVRLQLGLAQSELSVSVTPPPPPPPSGPIEDRIEPLDLPVPVWSAGFPGRALQPRTRVYALLGVGSTQASQAFSSARLDLGGEVALLRQRISIDANLPLLYYSNLAGPDGVPKSGFAIGDLSLGARWVAVRALAGQLVFGPLLRLQVPTGTFPRSAVGSLPVVLDPALALGGMFGRFGLLTTQGPTAVFNLPGTQARWSMSYTAEALVSRLSLLAQLDASIGMTSGSPTGASLGGGMRVRFGTSHLLAGVRGGLGQGGTEIFGRYHAFVGYEWVQK